MKRVYDEERLGELLRLLRPAPTGWVQAAQELPRARRTFDDIVARAEADRAFRAALIADLEQALVAEGYEPDRRFAKELRERLTEI
jgi:hypothetical protein